MTNYAEDDLIWIRTFMLHFMICTRTSTRSHHNTVKKVFLYMVFSYEI